MPSLGSIRPSLSGASLQRHASTPSRRRRWCWCRCCSCWCHSSPGCCWLSQHALCALPRTCAGTRPPCNATHRWRRATAPAAALAAQLREAEMRRYILTPALGTSSSASHASCQPPRWRGPRWARRRLSVFARPCQRRRSRLARPLCQLPHCVRSRRAGCVSSSHGSCLCRWALQLQQHQACVRAAQQQHLLSRGATSRCLRAADAIVLVLLADDRAAAACGDRGLPPAAC